MAEHHAARRAAVQQKISATGADAALITSAPNVRYLSGLVSSNAAILLPAAGAAVLATDSRYAEKAERDCPDLEVLTERELEPALARLAVRRGYGRLAFEAQEMTVERHALLAALDDGPDLVTLGHLVEDVRMVKDDAEIALLTRACALTAEAFAAVLGLITPGRTERSFAVALERTMIDLGATGLAFETIVASGPNGAIPHHSPGDREFARGDLITIDCGAEFGGYHADMTRTVALGEPGRLAARALRPGRDRPAGRRRGGSGRGRGQRRGRGGQGSHRGRRARQSFRARARPRGGPRGARSADDGTRPGR